MTVGSAVRSGIMRAVVVALVLALAVLTAEASLGRIKVNPETHLFVDEFGRTRIFRGVNAVYKVGPYYPPNKSEFDPSDSLNEKDADLLVSWGFNVVRLGLIWKGAEPQRGQYDIAYIKELKRITEMLASRGIYTILDNHQDLMSEKFCGEGAPDYIVELKNHTPTFPAPLKNVLNIDPETGYPKVSDCLKIPFFQYYFTYDLNKVMDEIYNNVDGKADAFAAMWRQVAEIFKGTEGLLGYELWNEPWPGDIYHDPLHIAGQWGYSEKKTLAPLYAKLNKAIREVDDDSMVFYETPQTNQFSSGFTSGPGGQEYFDREVLGFHVYCPLLDPNGDPRSKLVCDFYDHRKVAMRTKDGKRLGGGSFMTEFGAVSGRTAGAKEITELADLADEYATSWAYWMFKLYDDMTTQSDQESLFYPNGTLEFEKTRALVRSYAHAIQGVPVHQKFDAATGHFTLTYTANQEIMRPTEIYLSSFYYQNGHKVTVVPHTAATWELKTTDKNRLMVYLAPETKSSTPVTITVAPL
eukprot:Colp12_sorted_trinity150504_noHs@8228